MFARLLRQKEPTFGGLAAITLDERVIFSLYDLPGLFAYGFEMNEGEKVKLTGERVEVVQDTSFVAATDGYAAGRGANLRTSGRANPAAAIRGSEAAQITAAEKFRDEFNGFRSVIIAVDSNDSDVYARPPSGYEAGLTALRAKRRF